MQFGTAGIRGVFAEQIRTNDILALTAAITEVLGSGKYVIGNDTRRSCELFASVAATGLNYYGNDVDYIGIVPTPVLAFASRKGYTAGLSVTASHNPPQFCGVKIFDREGVGLQVQKERMLEEFLGSGPNPISINQGKTAFDMSVLDDYCSALLARAGNCGNRMKILVECVNGAASYVTARILTDLGHDVISLNCHKSHFFPGRSPEPISSNLTQITDLVKHTGVDLAVVHDGDADRLVVITADGSIVPDYALSYLMLQTVLEKARGDVVISINTSMRVEELAKNANCRVTRYRLGKTYEELRRRNGIYATEPSKIIDASWGLWEDGIHAATMLIQRISLMGTTITGLINNMPKTFYQQLNLEVSNYNRNSVKMRALKHFAERRISEIQEIDGLRIVFKDGSWILFRSSGTEPKVRIYAESVFEKDSLSLIENGKKILGV